MKIVHISLLSCYTEGFTYQDNILPKFHKKLGYDVTMITARFKYNKSKIELTNESNYINNNGVKIIRLNSNKDLKSIKKNKLSKFIKFNGLYDTLEKENPDILFVHGVCFLDIRSIVRYIKKHKNIKVYVDNHCDSLNSGKNFISKNVLHKIVWKHMAKLIEPYTIKFYGVLPTRVEWLSDMYKIPREKCELLIMGADDEIIEKIKNKDTRKKIDKEYGLRKTDFLIVTGGKIDKNKYQIMVLMKAIANMEDNIKLLVFGSVIDEYKKEFDNLCKNNNIIYVGWLDNEKSLEYFNSADIIVFPGLHSVFWEQVVALGKPLVCKRIYGANHIDIGGNVEYIENDEYEHIYQKIKDIAVNKAKYNNMLKSAKKSNKNDFLYSRIAKKSIDIG